VGELVPVISLKLWFGPCVEEGGGTTFFLPARTPVLGQETMLAVFETVSTFLGDRNRLCTLLVDLPMMHLTFLYHEEKNKLS
jgi:hypothetical protein